MLKFAANKLLNYFPGPLPPTPSDAATYSPVRFGSYLLNLPPESANDNTTTFIIKLTTIATNTTSFFWQVCTRSVYVCTKFLENCGHLKHFSNDVL